MVQLLDVVHADDKLYMVFEYLTMDLKKHMDESENIPRAPTEAGCPGLPPSLVKVFIQIVL